MSTEPLYSTVCYPPAGSEDCLFLNVLTPRNATGLPVLVWIHGGGYGTGQGNNDLSELIINNSHGFILVIIQYRLGAFGFLSSSEVAKYGTANAGLYDMHFSLKWVQDHIAAFGGDPTRVTIAGESAGAGAVMLQTMAYGGSQGTALFQNAIVASPYLPMQWDYDGLQPTQSYDRFVDAVGCGNAGQTPNTTVFSCLQGADSITLQNASTYVSGNWKYGQWAFLPVTDGTFIQERPSLQLLNGQLNGVRILSGNNADEGPVFVPQNITTKAAFNSYVSVLLPLMDNDTLGDLQEIYQISPTIPGPLFSTVGNKGPSALNQSEFGIGQQQRANNLYAETTFVCPSYWLATGFSKSKGKKAWKYQYSVPPSEHGADLDAYYAINREALGYGTLSTAFRLGVQNIWGRFIIYDDPTLTEKVLDDLTTYANGTKTGDNLAAALRGTWSTWETNGPAKEQYRMLNLNMTGGHETTISWTNVGGGKLNVTQYAGRGLQAELSMVDGYAWEAERGKRCQFWADVGADVPE
ncbi:carboxylic ester hydrolase-5 [Coleophoma crateriformis]|uniref:Carboxylic ester hydrolase n=1 Tax=Coleophoma crateriformis TaxID=565419 RepID=A0A3D8S3K2_9HELO|nr:carboxylic ester hydrolase-5 [Coleophoma crateriformis]